MGHRTGPFSAEQLLDSLTRLSTAKAYYVGFSGGADSTALLQALHELKGRVKAPVQAVHVNHGLHAEADLWQRHCEAFCQQRGIELTCLPIEASTNTGQGIEAKARHLRYQALAELLGPGDSLLTAHHADDQTETILLNLMRGSGVDGLSAMPCERGLGAGMLQRPLLEFDNRALQAYLRARDINWLEDPTNRSLDHDRNFMRHEIIPRLEQRWPGVNRRLSLTRRAMAETRPVLTALADGILQQSLAHPLVLRLGNLENAESGLFKLVVRRWLRQADAQPIPAHRLESLTQQLGRVDSDNRLCIRWEHCAIRLFRGCLWLQARHEVKPCNEVAWVPNSKAADLGSDIGRLELIGGKAPDPCPRLVSHSRQGGMRTSMLRNGHHHRLKNFFQAAAIPPWLRDSIPLTSLDGELAAIGDWYFSDHCSAWLKKNQLTLVWQPHHPLLRFIHDRERNHPPVNKRGDALK